MKDSRIGESLWLEWTGDGITADCVHYFTDDHVDLDNEIVRRALASALQRDGIAVSLAEGFGYIDRAAKHHMHAGVLDQELDLTLCDEDGMTEYGDFTNDAREITLVEICPDT